MKYIQTLIFVLILSLISLKICAQQGTVRGKVIAGHNGLPIAGVTVSSSLGKNLGISSSDGTFSVEMDPGNQILSFYIVDFEQAVISVTIMAGETTDAGSVTMQPLTGFRTDLGAGMINESVSEDGFETQSIQGVLNASADIFLTTAAYTFGPVMYRIRGYDANYQNVSLNGFVLNDIESGVPYFSNWGGLNDVMRNAMVTSGPEPVGFLFEPVGGITRISTRASEYRSGVKAVYSMSNRTYRNRAMVTWSTGLMNNNWAFTGSISRRWSERGYEEGTFYDANSFFISVEKKINARHSLNLTALNAVYHRGVAGGTTQEVYDLTGDNFYNPYWGYQNGKVRNSRVRSNNKPLITLAHFWNVSEKLDIQTTAGYWFGKSGYSAMNWYDVQDPRPDYYRKLPGYYTDQADQERIAGTWRQNPLVSQIDWDHFYFSNRKNIYTVRNAGGIEGVTVTGNRSKYIVEDRRDDLSQFQLNSRLSYELAPKLNMNGGFLADIFRGHHFNVVSDLLGGDYWLDIDQFAERDYPNNPGAFQNDLDHPDRVVKEGDTFGNNYYMFQRGVTLWETLRYSGKKVSVYSGGHVRSTTFWREGLMRKGLFPENSRGESEKTSFLTWGIKAGGDYRFTGRHMVVANALFTTIPPLLKNSFLSPRTRNSIVPGLTGETILSGDISYVLRSPSVTGRVTGFYTRFGNQTELTSFYHDEWRTLVNYTMSGIDKENLGIEAGVEINLTPQLVLNGVASVGQYLWTSNPGITITKDNNSEVLSNEEVWIQYFRQSGTPQTALSAGIEYNASRFWWVGITGSWYDHIYLDFNPVTRTKDKTGYYPYWETQKEVDSGFLLDLFAGKSWKVDDYYIGLSANISNLLNNRSFLTGGFEQYRFDPERPELFQPKLYYYNGFNYFVNLSLRF
jgi:hypothetical protein